LKGKANRKKACQNGPKGQLYEKMTLLKTVILSAKQTAILSYLTYSYGFTCSNSIFTGLAFYLKIEHEN